MVEHNEVPQAIPANVEAERALLGSILIDPDAIYKVSEFITPDSPYYGRHKVIYEAMLRLTERREPIDFVTLVDELERHDRLEEAGGPAYLSDILSTTPTALYANHYGRIVERKAGQRGWIGVAGKVAEIAYDDSLSLEELDDKASQVIFQMLGRRVRKTFTPIGSAMQAVVNRIEERSRQQGYITGVPTGFAMLDRMLGGLQKSDLLILAARPGLGKTAFALSIAQYAAKRHAIRTAFFSLEMSTDQLSERLLSMETGIDAHRLRTGQIHEEEWSIMLEAANVLASTSIFIDDTPAASVNDVRLKCRRMAAEEGLDLIIIDYMQLMTGGVAGNGTRSENRQQEISYISRSLKALAKELNVPIIALSQLSRAVENRADKRPMLSDLRESGQIEADADVILFIYREDYYIEDTDRQNIADILVAKHRHGATGTVSLYFREELTQFRDLEIQRTDLEY